MTVTLSLPRAPVTLAAGEVSLRGTTMDDAAAALEMFADPMMMQWYSGPTPLDLARVKQWCVSSADWSEASHATWTIADAADRFVGNLSLVRIDADARTAMIAYRVAPAARGRGVATAAVLAASTWAFEVVGLERVTLEHAAANPESCRVAVKAGYRHEGVLRAGYRDDDGRRWDAHLHARLRDDPVPARHPVR